MVCVTDTEAKRKEHLKHLLIGITELYKNPDQCSDVCVHVGSEVFKCHKLILALQSDVFKQKLFPPDTEEIVHQLTVNDTEPADFCKILQFLYTGEIELECETVGRLLQLVILFDLNSLKQICHQFLSEKLCVKCCTQFWRMAEDADFKHLANTCIELFTREFNRVTSRSSLRHVTRVMLEDVIDRDDLNIISETDVFDMLSKWLEVNAENDEPTMKPTELMSHVRWSGISFDFIKSKISVDGILTKDEEMCDYLRKVVLYRLSGIQFPGLRTHHRPSTGVETCVVIFGVDSGAKLTPECCRVSLQRQCIVGVPGLPTRMNYEVAACCLNNMPYVTGLGIDNAETWRWDFVSGWARCGNMIQGRRRHSATFVNNTTMYALGGFVDSTKTTLSCVEQFNTLRNNWMKVGHLVHCTSHAGCAAYNSIIYLFGGYWESNCPGKDVDLDYIQEYDTTTEQCTVLTQRLPRAHMLLRAVLWDESIILMNNLTCMVFDLEKKTIQLRNQFAVGLAHGGLVVDNSTLFFIGGGASRNGNDGIVTWSGCDEVKCVPVMDIMCNQHSVKWTTHCKLATGNFVRAFTCLTLPRPCNQ